MPFPNFIIGGPPKTGTTSLFSWLSDHPDVCVSSVKETYHFYSREEERTGIVQTYSDQEIAAYSAYFKDCEGKKVICEATPSYLYSKSAIAPLKAINDDLKILFIYREPADRLYSEFSFHRYKTKRFKGSFKSYIGDVQLAQSDYHPFLKNWVDGLGADKVKLIHFTDLQTRPNEVMKAICNELGLAVDFYENRDLAAKNQTADFRNRWLHVQLLKIASIVPKKFTDAVAPWYYKLNSKGTPDKDNEDLYLLEELKKQLSPSTERVMNDFAECFIPIR